MADREGSATSASSKIIVEVSQLVKAYDLPNGGSLLALDELSFAIEDKQFVCILGPSGCGKSTLLNIIAGLDVVTDGSVTVAGTRYGDHRNSRSPSMAFVFQDSRLLPWLTVEQNLFFAMDCRKAPKSEWHEKVKSALELVGLGGFERYYAHQLSGGMQQRTSIARALCVDPDILLMDEPFSGLDEITARRLRVELLSIWNRMRKTVLFVTHNAFEAAFLADRILVITGRPGRLHEDIRVPLKRPRDYDDPDLFALSVDIVKRFLLM